MRIIPAGMYEVGEDGTRFLPVRGSATTTVLTLAGGLLVGMLLGRRGRRPRKPGR
jgi:hypothetical protein